MVLTSTPLKRLVGIVGILVGSHLSPLPLQAESFEIMELSFDEQVALLQVKVDSEFKPMDVAYVIDSESKEPILGSVTLPLTKDKSQEGLYWVLLRPLQKSKTYRLQMSFKTKEPVPVTYEASFKTPRRFIPLDSPKSINSFK